MLNRSIKVTIVVCLSAVAGVAFGLAARKGRAQQAPPPRAHSGPVVSDKLSPGKAVPNPLRAGPHTLHGSEITSPAPGLIRLRGTYTVNPGTPWPVDMAVHYKVEDRDTGEVVWDGALTRGHFEPADRASIPLELDLPSVPPGVYTARLYVYEVGRSQAGIDGSRSPMVYSGRTRTIYVE